MPKLTCYAAIFGTLAFPLAGLLLCGPMFFYAVPAHVIVGTSLGVGAFAGFLVHTT